METPLICLSKAFTNPVRSMKLPAYGPGHKKILCSTCPETRAIVLGRVKTRGKPPSTSEKLPVPTSLSTVKSHMPNGNFFVATATLVTVTFCCHNSTLSCVIQNETFDMRQQQETLYFGYTNLGSYTRVPNYWGGGLENSRKFNKWEVGVIGRLNIFENLINWELTILAKVGTLSIMKCDGFSFLVHIWSKFYIPVLKILDNNNWGGGVGKNLKN